MLSMNRISVVITSYNQRDFLKEAIESVLNQTHLPFEIIVCDDFSEDGSKDLIRGYEKRFPNLIVGIFSLKNQGISKNRNSGLKIVRGNLVTWLDGDDIFRPKKLELELEEMSLNNDIRWVYSQVIEMDIADCDVHLRYSELFKGKIFEKVVGMLGRAPRNPLVQLETLKNENFFDEDMEMYEDFDLCLKLAKYYKCAYRKEPLVEYRIHSGGIHNIASHKHIINLQHLHNNLNKLLEDESKQRKRKLERSFLDKVNYILLLKGIEEGKIVSSFIFFIKWLSFQPLRILKMKVYAKCIKRFFWDMH